MDYITIASLGNAIDFGDLSVTKDQGAAAASPVRGVWLGGENPANTAINDISYIQIMSTGDSIDFGDTAVNSRVNTGLSNGHGGLG